MRWRERFVHLQRKRAPQQRLADQQQSEVARGIHVEVQQQRQLFQGGMRQQLGFVADENGMLLFALVETHDGIGDLAHQVAAEVRRLQVQFQGDLAQQVQRRAGGEVQVEDLVEVGIERGGEDARGGGLAGAHFAGEQADAVMLRQKLEPRLDLIPGLGGEQLFGVGAVGEGRFLEAEEGFPHGYFSSVSQGGNSPLTTASTSRATAFRLAFGVDLQLGEIERIEAHFDALAGQMRRRFEETILQQEGGIAAHQAVHAMKEQTAQIGGRRKLADLFDIALPAQQRRGLERAVFAAVIDRCRASATSAR